MSRKALIRSSDGLLLEHGFIDYQAQSGQTVLDVADDFSGQPKIDAWDGSAWAPALTVAKALKVAALSKACAAEILSGFTSDALGAVHAYGGDIETQVNLLGLKLIGGGGLVRCAVGTNLTASRTQVLHTAEQVDALVADGVEKKKTALAHLEELRGLVALADDLADLDAITW